MANYYKFSLFSLFTFLFSLLVSSCQEGSEAGDLLGQWQMTDTHYISFSGSVVWLKDTNGENVFGNFQHQGDSLFIQCYSVEGSKADTITVEESFGFKPFNNIRVKIAALDNDELVITKGNQTWSFYKY